MPLTAASPPAPHASAANDESNRLFMARPDVRHATRCISQYRGAVFSDTYSYDCTVNPEGDCEESFANARDRARVAMARALDALSNADMDRVLKLTERWSEGSVDAVMSRQQARDLAFEARPDLAPSFAAMHDYRTAVMAAQHWKVTGPPGSNHWNPTDKTKEAMEQDAAEARRVMVRALNAHQGALLQRILVVEMRRCYLRRRQMISILEVRAEAAAMGLESPQSA